MYLYYTSESYLEPLYHWEPKWIHVLTDHVFVLYQWKLFGVTVSLGTKVNTCATDHVFVLYQWKLFGAPVSLGTKVVCATDHVFVLYQWKLFGATVSLGTKSSANLTWQTGRCLVRKPHKTESLTKTNVFVAYMIIELDHVIGHHFSGRRWSFCHYI